MLVAAPEVPEAERQSGSRHLFQEVALLTELGASVTVVYMYEGRPHDRILLEQLGAPVFPFSELPLLLSTREFDVALLAFWNFAEQCIPVIRERSEKTRIMIDSIDLHFVRRAREELREESAAQQKDGDAEIRRRDAP